MNKLQLLRLILTLGLVAFVALGLLTLPAQENFEIQPKFNIVKDFTPNFSLDTNNLECLQNPDSLLIDIVSNGNYRDLLPASLVAFSTNEPVSLLSTYVFACNLSANLQPVYTWTYADGTVFSSEANPIVYGLPVGEYFVTLKLDLGNLSKTATKTVFVYNLADLEKQIVNTPPVVQIVRPQFGEQFSTSAYCADYVNYDLCKTITLSANASDTEDGDLPNSSVEWFLFTDIQAGTKISIGTGKVISYEFRIPYYTSKNFTVVAQARDSKGELASEVGYFTINNDYYNFR